MDQWVSTLFTDVFHSSIISCSRNTLIRRSRDRYQCPKNQPLRYRRLDDLGGHHVGNLHFAQERQVSRMDTNAELADMHLAYGAANCSGPAAQRLYAERYPMRRIPPVIISLQDCTKG
ncbi:hypothetical protein TNCV_4395751 [Trichonephila clavipes]|uniref:DUF4817 domain-containing protein n=1 Tax=Trichonephila clavipes TaxID=2585209 RepID=A0A8X6W5R8_TRICX|nr:hypothetical protein TNCV_4395751 [Trichonephila clavipes]